MNYIEQITKYLTDHNREDEIPFVLLSARVQGREFWASNNEMDTYRNKRTLEELENLDVDELMAWDNTKEGWEYWNAIQKYCRLLK